MRNIGNHHQCQLDSFWFWTIFHNEKSTMNQNETRFITHTHTLVQWWWPVSMVNKVTCFFFKVSSSSVKDIRLVFDSQPASQNTLSHLNMMVTNHHHHQGCVVTEWPEVKFIGWLANLGYTEKHSKDYMKQKKKEENIGSLYICHRYFISIFFNNKKNFLKKFCR